MEETSAQIEHQMVDLHYLQEGNLLYDKCRVTSLQESCKTIQQMDLCDKVVWSVHVE